MYNAVETNARTPLFSEGKIITVQKLRYPLEELARRGDEIYEHDIRARVEPAHNEEIVAIDIDTGEWELDVSEDVAADRLEARLLDAQI